MASAFAVTQHAQGPPATSLRSRIESEVEHSANLLGDPEQMSPDQRRGIIARYTAVLEGNFIYWMTGAYLSVKADASRVIILSNLHEEVRDCHPGMLRRFAVAAHAYPADSDALAVSRDLMAVRLFVGRLSGIPILVMMTFFECFIQRFMTFLAELAALQGSKEQEYTEVHGVCDVAHTQELFCALAAEMEIDPPASGVDLFEGIDLLKTLLRIIVSHQPAPEVVISCRE